MRLFGVYHGGATSREIFSGFYVVFPEKSQDMTMFVVILHVKEKVSFWKKWKLSIVALLGFVPVLGS